MRIALTIALVLGMALWAAANTAEAPHVKVEYQGIDGKQAASIANTLSAAYDVYGGQYKFNMPPTVTCSVSCDADAASLFTDGVDRVTLRLKSSDQLRPPAKGNPFNLYGMCHELGHMAMYRLLKDHSWLTTAAAEGWAHYVGSHVVDRVYEARGQNLWWEPYDYRAEGTARLEKQLARDDQDEVTRGAGQWRELEKIIGREGFARLFAAWDKAQVDPYEPAKTASRVLVETFPEKKEALSGWWKTASKVLVTTRERSDVARSEVKKTDLTGKPVKIALDDDKMDGQKSIAGGGHARTFDAPEGEWYIVAVWVHGQRYGPTQPPATRYTLSLCDPSLKPIAQWERAYREFPWGKMKWVKLEVPPTKVPEKFAVCVHFNPSARNGVYVGFDSSTSGNSVVGMPGEQGAAFEQGDWMIRVELDRLK